MTRSTFLVAPRELAPTARAEARAALTTPWCWPHASSQQRAARKLASPPAPLRSGETLLVSIEGTRTTLWSAAPQGQALRSGADARPLIGTAASAAELAWRLAARDAPLLRKPERLHRATTWRAVPVARSGIGKAPRALDGASYGLALLLGAVSWLTDQPLSAKIIGLAALEDTGRLAPVEGLEAKLGALSRWAAGVSQIAVHESQADAAREFADRLEWEADVIACHSISDAIPHALSPARATWDPPAASRAAQLLYRQAVFNEVSLLGWESVAATAAELESFVTNETDRAAIQFARAIGERHLGQSAPLPWPDPTWLTNQPRPVRQTLLAHVVQSHTDATSDRLAEIIDRALATLPPPIDRHAEDLRLLGACVRALSATRDWEHASSLAGEAVRGWSAMHRLANASYALSEWLRVLGLLRRADDLAHTEEEFVTPFLHEPTTTATDRRFVLFALGRAAILTGDHVRALRALADHPDWSHAPFHLRCARRRWLARAHACADDAAGADATRHALREELGPSGDPNFDLIQLDVCLASGADPAPILRSLLQGSEADTFARIISGAALDATSAERVADEYPY